LFLFSQVKLKMIDPVLQITELQPIFHDADHIDVKTVEGRVSLRVFIASMMAYQPEWVTFLYRIRAVFVRLLGMKQEGIPKARRIEPADVPMLPGQRAAFFKVRAAKEDTYWVVEIKDTHLNAVLGVVVEPLPTSNRFRVFTVVHYHTWQGPVYFNVIRPFHHLVVGGMARAGVKRSPPAGAIS
jgi:hypothetical protein